MGRSPLNKLHSNCAAAVPPERGEKTNNWRSNCAAPVPPERTGKQGNDTETLQRLCRRRGAETKEVALKLRQGFGDGGGRKKKRNATQTAQLLCRRRGAEKNK